LALFIGIIPFSILLWKKRALDNKEAVVPFIWVTAVATLYEYFVTELLYINSTYWFQLYTFLEIVCLFYYFYRILGQQYKKSIYLMLALLLIVYTISCFFWSNMSSLVSLAINACSISLFIFIFAFLHFKTLMEKENSLWEQPNFHFTVGFSIYYSCTLLLFLLSKELYKTNHSLDPWLINILAGIILRTLLITGTWKMKAN
jgi:hypothetical protein